MSKIDTGGRAYPNKGGNCGGYDLFDGMTLLDYFAGRAPDMTEQWYKDSVAQWPEKHWAQIFSEWCYFWAAAMVAEKRRLESL